MESATLGENDGMSILLWLRRDLRLEDNPALSAAWARGLPIEVIYIDDPVADGDWTPGSASRWYLHQSLADLGKHLALQGLCLDVIRAETVSCLRERFAKGVTALYFNRIPEPAQSALEERVAHLCHTHGVSCNAHDSYTLFPPASLCKADGTPYKVFTPFWKNLRVQLQSRGHTPLTPPSLAATCARPTSERYSPRPPALFATLPWHHKLHTHWQPGERHAQRQLTRFTENDLSHYSDDRNRPDYDRTSRLSAALHFGELSPWRVYAAAEPALQGLGPVGVSQAERFIAQLAWREFAFHVLHWAPDSPNRSLNAQHDALWRFDDALLAAWKNGETGFDLVDAGLRELWETGYMHNRVRMVTASFLTKNLGLHWRQGARWFWDTLVDADLANNTLGWQWVAGCGVDAAPYYRIFNPDLQAERFDPHATYRRRWLGNRPRPLPIVDLNASRRAALDRYQHIKNSP